MRSFFSTHSTSAILNGKPREDPRPYVKITVHDNLVLYGLLDSGSAVTILGNKAHEHLINQFSLKLCTDELVTVTAAGGQNLSSLGYILLPFAFEDRESIIKAHVIPEVNTTLILGIDFWNSFNLCPKYIVKAHRRPFLLFD